LRNRVQTSHQRITLLRAFISRITEAKQVCGPI